jgi:hypothetical protein
MDEVYNKIMYGMPSNPKKNIMVAKKSVGGSKGTNKMVGGHKMTSKMVM